MQPIRSTLQVLRRNTLLLESVLVIFCLSRCGSVDKPEEVVQAEQSLPQELDYNLHVKPILSDKCFFCHGPDKAAIEAGLSLSDETLAFASLESGNRAIVPGNLAKSEVFHRITADDPEMIMPPPESNLSLTAYEKAVLLKWIEEGAEYKPHWALIKPKKYPLPAVQQQDWPQNPIDHFVLDKLEREGLTPAPEADKETLLRRVSLDLTGLPPTVAEMDDFLADTAPNAYEKVVDRLLASSHYGEKLATDWMDVSRYADTHGYSVDRYRPAWPWRDWVIQAFNENIPFDQFTTWQLAGDLLPQATPEQKLATGFNRNHAQNMEGGIVNEEYRVEYVADRTNTLGTAFLGLTVECARCHDHKYDPISQKEYYSLSGFFNNIDEAGQISWDNAMPVPTMLMPDEQQDSLIAFIDAKITETQQQLEQIRETEQPVFAQRYAEGKLSLSNRLEAGLQAHFTLDHLQQGQFVNRVSSEPQGSLPDPVLVEGKLGKAVKLNGDEELKLGKVGIFERADPFSIALWVHIPKAQKEGVIFHKGEGAILYSFRGYHLALRENKFELLMAHTWPYNNIIRLSEQEAPKEQWVHLTVTYDGSSQADGFRLFLDGQPVAMHTEKDHLYKDILFPALDHEPGLQIGARMRGVGFKNGLVDDIKVYERELTLPEIAELAGQAQEPEAATTLTGYFEAYLQQQVKAYPRQLHQLQQLRRQKNRITEAVAEVMIMDELEGTRPTYLLERGVYDAHGEEVQPTTPASVLPFPDTLPQNRLGLAQWLMHPDNPLTSRVIVNRYWQTYFGRGLVKTAADFGNQGEMPSHPRLLDWLAITFRESGWDIKALQKMIVMSATYRQSSTVPSEQRKDDPENLLLARGPSARMSAEMLRDCALASSGLLTPNIGGPSVKPYQPEGLWAFNGGHYEPDQGDKLYRRSLYTFWKRTVPPPTMNTFDAPDRSYCVVKRQQTSTPLQALIMLNDPQFVEAARVIAQKVIQEKAQPTERINHTFRLLTGRSPKPQESQILQELLTSETAKFEQSPEKAEGWLSQGDTPSTSGASPVALASYTVLASTIMNSDAFITKR
ncbi:MAG: DUF1553 domain-containing protein [Cyclobacteriaceae bacterium]